MTWLYELDSDNYNDFIIVGVPMLAHSTQAGVGQSEPVASYNSCSAAPRERVRVRARHNEGQRYFVRGSRVTLAIRAGQRGVKLLPSLESSPDLTGESVFAEDPLEKDNKNCRFNVFHLLQYTLLYQ